MPLWYIYNGFYEVNTHMLYSGLGSLGRLSLDSISIYSSLEKFRTLGFAKGIGPFYPFRSIIILRYSAPFLGFTY